MFNTNLFKDSKAHKILKKIGNYSVLEYEKELSVRPEMAMKAYYASMMNVRKRQVIIELEDEGCIVQAGSVQLWLGDVEASSNVKSAGDFVGKFFSSKITGESVVKPLYKGTGILLLEPTFNHIIFQDLADWNGGIVIEDGMFIASDDTVDMKMVTRNTVSSALLGNEGLFNTSLEGEGIVALESPVPIDELIVIDLKEDTLKIDGNLAIAWSKDLKFTVEKATKTLTGSAASGEGLVNTYRGTGRVLVAPISGAERISSPEDLQTTTNKEQPKSEVEVKPVGKEIGKHAKDSKVEGKR